MQFAIEIIDWRAQFLYGNFRAGWKSPAQEDSRRASTKATFCGGSHRVIDALQKHSPNVDWWNGLDKA